MEPWDWDVAHRPPSRDDHRRSHYVPRSKINSVLDDGALVDHAPFSNIDRVFYDAGFQARTGPNRSVVSHRHRASAGVAGRLPFQ